MPVAVAVLESLEADVVVMMVEVVKEEVVCVAAINAAGLKAQELADGDAELSDEYVSFSVLLLMFVRMSWAEFQQMLICPEVLVQTSLLIRLSAMSHSRWNQKQKEKKNRKSRRTCCRDSTRYCLHRRTEECCHRWHSLW